MLCKILIWGNNVLYFAYGSMLDWDEMQCRCPSVKFVCLAALKGHRLEFTRKSQNRGCGVADVVPDSGKDVWGVIYDIPEREIGRLDKAEELVRLLADIILILKSTIGIFH